MKERFLKVLKWFFIILGIIFFIQILILFFISMSFVFPYKIDSIKFKDISPSKNNLEQIQPIIDYAENYYNKNNKYPDKIEDKIKIKKDYDYKYEVSKNNICYTVTLYPIKKEKGKFIKKEKNEKTKQYQHCKSNSENFSSASESYLEF